jgi:hypothetical protein
MVKEIQGNAMKRIITSGKVLDIINNPLATNPDLVRIKNFFLFFSFDTSKNIPRFFGSIRGNKFVAEEINNADA